MQDDLFHYVNGTLPSATIWRPISIDSAKPYIKAIAIVTMLLVIWVGLGAI